MSHPSRPQASVGVAEALPQAAATSSLAPIGRRQLAQLGQELSDRHRAVLESLSALHFATTRHIERLHFQGTGLTPLSGARLAHRCLAHLLRLGLVDRLARRVGGVRAGSASFVWRLSPAGIRLIDNERARRREPSATRLAHVLDVTELVVRLDERGRTRQLEVLGIETEPACWRRFVGPHGRQRWLKPDLRVTLGVDVHSLHWFVEIDRSTEDRSTLARKLAVYVAAWRDGREQAAVGVFPGVLWVVPDPARAGVIESVISTSTEAPQGMFAVSVHDEAVETLMGEHLDLI